MLGGFAPLPIRLGGTDREGWTAAQHARAADHLAAIVRTLPFAWVRVERSPSLRVAAYCGMDGIGAPFAPHIIASGAGEVTVWWEWARETLDAYGQHEPVTIRHATANIIGPLPIVANVALPSASRAVVTTTDVTSGDPVNVPFTLVVY